MGSDDEKKMPRSATILSINKEKKKLVRLSLKMRISRNLVIFGELLRRIKKKYAQIINIYRNVDESKGFIFDLKFDGEHVESTGFIRGKFNGYRYRRGVY